MAKPTKWVCAQRKLRVFTAHRLIWVFAGCTLILLVLSCRGSHVNFSCVQILRVFMVHLSQSVTNQQNDLYVKQRLRPACASIQSGESVRCAPGPNTSSCGQWILIRLGGWDWSDWVDAHADLSLHWAHRSFYCCFHALAHLCYFMRKGNLRDLGIVILQNTNARPALERDSDLVLCLTLGVSSSTHCVYKHQWWDCTYLIACMTGSLFLTRSIHFRC